MTVTFSGVFSHVVRRLVPGAVWPARGFAGRAVVATVVATIVVAALGVLPGTGGDASAFTIATASKYSKKTKHYTKSTVIYHLNPNGSGDMSKKAALDSLRKGFQGWMDVPCGDLTFKEGYHCNLALKTCVFDKGKACSQDTDCPAAFNLKVMPIGYKNNGRNELVFIEDNKWTLGEYVLGVTLALHNYNGVIVESDIAFNGYLQKWTTDPNKFGGGWSHLPSVAIHEEGHFFGVMHNLGGWSKSDPPTMTPYVQPYGISATLSGDDKKAICFLNPKDGAYSCNNDGDCPYVMRRDNTGKEYYGAKYACKSGTCVWGKVTGQSSKKLGDSCISQMECAKPTYCQPIGGQSVCASQCNPQSKNCPGGFTCYGYQGQPTKGACLKTPGTVTKKDNGEACSQSQECTSLFCLQGACEQPCTPGDETSCAAGSVCQQISGGAGICVKSTGPALGGEGTTCQDPSECASGVCMKNDLQATVGYCRDKCTGPGACGEGYKCVSQGEGYQGCLPGKENIASGGVCKFDEQCQGGACILAGDAGKICSQSCSVGDAKSCPCGMACQNASNGAVCFPAKPLGCLPGGEPCVDGGECTSSICANGSCQKSCNIIYGRDSCAVGEGCVRVGPAKVAGYCAPKGNVGEGKFCLGDALCVTLFCDKDVTHNNETRCGLPCDPAAETCGAGQKCNPLSSSYGACYVSGEAAGDVAIGADVAGAEVGAGVVGTLAASDSGSGCSAGRNGGRRRAAGGLLLIALMTAVLIGRRRGAWRAQRAMR